MIYLRKILGVIRMDKIHNTKIRDRLNRNQNLGDTLRVKQLSYFGHTKRMPSYTCHINSPWKDLLLENAHY